MLEHHSPRGIGKFSVEATDGKLMVRAKAYLGVRVPVEAVAVMEIEEDDKLMVRLEKIGNLPGPVKDLVAHQIERINPLVETDDWPAKVKLETVEVGEGLIVVRGQLLGA